MPAEVVGERAPAAPDSLDAELVGLDHLELVAGPRASLVRRAWSATWPKLAAIALALLGWRLVVWSGWKEPWQLPPPGPVFEKLGELAADGTLGTAVRITMVRAIFGFAVAFVIGVAIGSLVSQVRVLRTAVGALITGLQTMPSIAWFPLAIVLFQISEQAILFVVVLGAAPAIANGIISGADQVPPILLRAGRVLGASRFTLWRTVVLPGSMPSFIGGLKQGWAFTWRSLMAGELLVIIVGQNSIGAQLQFYREFANVEGLMAMMIVILVIGIVVDTVCFGTAERFVRRRWGLGG